MPEPYVGKLRGPKKRVAELAASSSGSAAVSSSAEEHTPAVEAATATAVKPVHAVGLFFALVAGPLGCVLLTRAAT